MVKKNVVIYCPYRPLSRRLDRCDRVIQDEVGDSKGSFKCYVTLEGVGGYMPKRYEALRGGGGVHRIFFYYYYYLIYFAFRYIRYISGCDSGACVCVVRRLNVNV